MCHSTMKGAETWPFYLHVVLITLMLLHAGEREAVTHDLIEIHLYYLCSESMGDGWGEGLKVQAVSTDGGGSH